MKESFEEIVKKRINELSLKESGYKPDLERIWKNSIKEIGPIEKKRKLLSIWTHAAALLFGIFLSACVFYFLNRETFISLPEQGNLQSSVISKKSEPLYESVPEKSSARENLKTKPNNNFKGGFQQKEIAAEIRPKNSSALLEAEISVNPEKQIDPQIFPIPEKSNPKAGLEVVYLSDYRQEFSTPKIEPSQGLWAIYEQNIHSNLKDTVKNSFVYYFLKPGNAF